MTIEDVRFAWEDVNLNKVLHETPQTQWLDSVTGNIVKFAVIDDLHWSLSFDTPDYLLMEGEVRPGSNCTSFYYCFYSPSHYMKQFHQDYADADKLQAVDRRGRGWRLAALLGPDEQLWHSRQLALDGPLDPWPPSPTPSTRWTPTPTSIEVDPHGNQLPYNDGIQIIKSRAERSRSSAAWLARRTSRASTSWYLRSRFTGPTRKRATSPSRFGLQPAPATSP